MQIIFFALSICVAAAVMEASVTSPLPLVHNKERIKSMTIKCIHFPSIPNLNKLSFHLTLFLFWLWCAVFPQERPLHWEARNQGWLKQNNIYTLPFSAFYKPHVKYVVYITIHASLKLVLYVSDVGQTNEYLPLHVWIRFMGKRTSLEHGIIQHKYIIVHTYSLGPIEFPVFQHWNLRMGPEMRLRVVWLTLTSSLNQLRQWKRERQMSWRRDRGMSSNMSLLSFSALHITTGQPAHKLEKKGNLT